MLLEHRPLKDAEIWKAMFEINQCILPDEVDISNWDSQKHLGAFDDWLHHGRHCRIFGLEKFQHRSFSVGATGGIESFLHHNKHRRLRFSQAEYVANKVICNSYNISWAWLEDGYLETGDALVISLPFSGNGSTYPDFEQLMANCTEKSIPVCLDVAYVGIAFDIAINVDYPCVTDVITSLSKPFVSMLRHGIVYRRTYVDDPIQDCTRIGMLPRLNICISTKLMKTFSKDYIVDKYQSVYLAICEEKELSPTNCITLAQGDPHRHKDFFRGGFYRICLTDELLVTVTKKNLAILR